MVDKGLTYHGARINLRIIQSLHEAKLMNELEVTRSGIYGKLCARNSWSPGNLATTGQFYWNKASQESVQTSSTPQKRERQVGVLFTCNSTSRHMNTEKWVM